MANQTTKKRKPSDFKRVKAKVGKRALKPANETDTSFKTASVNVGKQNVSQNREKDAAADEEDEEILELYSSRGRSIEDLASHLRHPAAPVRTSAARGLKDAVTRQQTTSKLIRSHLAILMPVCAKCCVDEHFEVRELALVILRVVITKVCSSSDEDNSNSDVDGSLYLKPFIPLLIAHVNSALNSLDRNTQLDGTKLVGMLSTFIPAFMAPYSSEILPAYVGILSHRSSQGFASGLEKSVPGSTTNTSKKKSSKNKKNNTEPSMKSQIIQSLLSLLKTTSHSEKRAAQAETKRKTSTGPDLSVVSGGRSVNAIFIPGSKSPQNSFPLLETRNIEDIPNFLSNTAKQGSNRRNFGSLGWETICELLGRLRDAFAEVTPKDQPRYDLSEISLILETTQIFYKSCCAPNLIERSPENKDPFVKIWSQFIVLIMELFPIVSSSDSPGLVLEVKLEISMLMLDAYLDGLVSERKHFDEVLAFLFSELEKCKPTGDTEGEDDSAQTSAHVLFDAFQRLLAIAGEGEEEEHFRRDTHIKVVRTLSDSFFPLVEDESLVDKNNYKAVARSQMGRKCAMLLVRQVFPQHDWSLKDLGGDFSKMLMQILTGFVKYLVAWECDFLYETTEVVALLHSVVRRLDVATRSISKQESHLVDELRSGLDPLFRYKKKLQLDDSGVFISGTRFELYPQSLQKKLIGLIVMLQSPSQPVLDGLSLICARCRGGKSNTVTEDMASLIVQSIHTIRKTVSMQSYLGFITNSMGVANLSSVKSVAHAQDIIQFDAGVQLTGGILCQCGVLNVLPLLQPLLGKWLHLTDECSLENILQARAAISILSRCLSQWSPDSIIVFEAVPELEEPITQALCSMLKSLPPCDGKEAGRGSDDKNLTTFLEPLITLFQYQGKLLPQVFDFISSDIGNLSAGEQTRLLSALLVIAKDLRLSKRLKGNTDLVSSAKIIETAVAGGSTTERLGNRLRALLEVHVGNT